MKNLNAFATLSLSAIILFAAACSNSPDNLVKPSVDNSLATSSVSASVAATAVPADNYTTAALTVTAKNYDPSVNGALQVTMTTDKGTFTNGTTTFTAGLGTDGTTTAYLKDNNAESATIKVTVSNNFSKTLAVTFTTALPDQIQLQPASGTLSVSAGASDALKAILIKTNGSASTGQYLTLYDSTATTGKSVGTFLNGTPSDGSGNINANYALQDTSYRGFIYLKGYVKGDPKKVTGVTRILVTR